MMEDLYQILKVTPTASSQQIKEAYYRLAKIFHPDKSKGNRFLYEEKFKKITTAYSVLSNEDQKKKYDQERLIHLKFKSHQKKSPPQTKQTETQAPNQTPLSHQSLDARLNLQISLEDSHTGCIKNIHFKRNVNRVEKSIKLSIKIPQGVRDGQKLLLKGQSHQLKSQKGNLVIMIKVKKHPLFQRQKQNLYMKLPLSITDALLGKKMTIPSLTGQVYISIKPHVYSGQLLKLKGQGFYFKDGTARGDLILEIKIDIPKQITEEDKKWFKDFKKREIPSTTVTEFNSEVQKLLLQRAS